MRPITVREYIDGAAKGRQVFIKTDHLGLIEVTGIRHPETDPWVICGHNSFMVHYGTELLVEDEAA